MPSRMKRWSSFGASRQHGEKKKAVSYIARDVKSRGISKKRSVMSLKLLTSYIYVCTYPEKRMRDKIECGKKENPKHQV